MGYSIKIEKREGQSSSLKMDGMDLAEKMYGFSGEETEMICKGIVALIATYGAAKISAEIDQTADE